MSDADIKYTLQEADKREDGRFTHQLDGNFSGVQYNILNFDQNSVSVSPSVIVPIRKRDTLYEFPHPHGRKVNFDHGNRKFSIFVLLNAIILKK